MKYLAIIMLLLFGISCSKDETIIEPEVYNGIASGLINGEELIFSPRMTPSYGNDSTYSLLIDLLKGDNVLKKTIHFSYIKPIVEVQLLKQFDFYNKIDLQCSYATRIGDGDVAGNYYYLNADDDIEDYLQLTNFNKSTGEVTGIFQASFVVDTAQIFDTSSPEIIVITNGYFETTIIN